MPCKYAALLNKVRETKPLIEQITNFVTVNDCANITLEAGASPVMADAPEEAAEFASASMAVVLNLGAVSERAVSAMIAAGKAANAKGIPVVFDPVGAGASKYRNDTIALLLNEVAFSVIRGNISEISFMAGLGSGAKGVDASESDLAAPAHPGEIAQGLAKKLNTVVVISGAVDTIADGEKIIYVENGHPMMGNITGTGCMCSALIGSFCGASSGEPLAAAAAAMLCMGIAGELAYESAGQRGNGSFRIALHDAMSRMNAETMAKFARYREE